MNILMDEMNRMIAFHDKIVMNTKPKLRRAQLAKASRRAMKRIVREYTERNGICVN